MTRVTRYFLLSSVVILVVGFCAGLIAYYGGFPAPSLFRADGPRELQYVPSDAAVVAYANVREVMDSEFRRRVRDAAPHGVDGQREFEERTGINIETDVDHVVACLAGEDSSSRSSGRLALVRGRFDEARIEGLLRQHGATVEQYRGKRVLTHVERRGDRMALAFVEPGLVAMGHIEMVRRAIAIDREGRSVRANADMMRVVRDLEGGDAWALGRFDALASQARLPEEVTRRMPAVTWFSAVGNVNGGVSGTLRAESRDEEAANNLRDVIRGFVALAKLQGGSKPEVQAMLQAFELGGTGKTVELSFAVPSEVIDLIAPGHRSRPQEKPKD